MAEESAASAIARSAETLTAALRLAADHPLGAETGLRFVARNGGEPPRISWREQAVRAAEVAGALRRRGVGSGERVAIVYPTGPAFFDAFFGTLAAGAVPVPLYPPVRLGRLDEYHETTGRMLEAVGARLVLADARVRRLLGRAAERASPRLGTATLEELPAGAESVVSQGEPDDLALVQFSSGTTVAPKPVALSHRAVLAQARILGDFLPDSDELRQAGVSWLPLYHDMGLIGCVMPALTRPADLTLIPPELFVARPAIWLQTLSRVRGTVSPAPNFAYALCVDRIRDDELDGVDLSSWRLALNGAEAVAPAVLRRFQRRFAQWGFRAEALTPVYGLAEAALAVTFSSLEEPFRSRRFEREALVRDGVARPREGASETVADAEDDATGAQPPECSLPGAPDASAPGGATATVELASVGRPVPGFELELRDESGRSVEEGRVGRLFVRGPSLMTGYLDQPHATAEVLRDGWLDTGDLGFRDGGELFLTGRAKDVLILRGRNHSPESVEHVVDDVDGVRTGCSVGVSHREQDDESERLLLFVEHRRDFSGAPEELARVCRERVLGQLGLDALVEVVEPGTLPRTSSGKLRRSETLRRWLDGELGAPRAPGVLGMARELWRSRAALRRVESERIDRGEGEGR